jgi:hypothetical protein
MTANVNYGQVVRGIGPEHQKGTFTGVLDMRGMVKVANAILALKTAQSPDWDAKRDGALKAWVKEYTNWLETNPIAKKTASSAKFVLYCLRYLDTETYIQQSRLVLLWPISCSETIG